MYGKSQDADPAAGAWGGIWGYRLMTRRAHGSRQSVIDEVGGLMRVHDGCPHLLRMELTW